MCRAMEKMREEERWEEKRETVLRMLKAGKYTIEEIAEISGLPKAEIEQISQSDAVLV